MSTKNDAFAANSKSHGKQVTRLRRSDYSKGEDANRSQGLLSSNIVYWDEMYGGGQRIIEKGKVQAVSAVRVRDRGQVVLSLHPAFPEPIHR